MKNYLTIKETERLYIRPLILDDIPAWKNFVSNKEAIKFFPFINPGNPQLEAEIWFQKQFERYDQNRFGLMALVNKETNEFIGQCGLLSQSIGDCNEVEIGYSLLPNYWGNGFAIEAARKFKGIAFANNYCTSVISIIHIDNMPSQKVAYKNGMSIEKEILFHDLPVFIFRTLKV